MRSRVGGVRLHGRSKQPLRKMTSRAASTPLRRRANIRLSFDFNLEGNI